MMLQNLTHRQVVLIDIMWKISGEKNIAQFLGSISKEDRDECLVLIDLIKAEFLDSVDSLDLAREEINKIRKL
jgi:5-bromo-4-chloroindolyl phosphate hydrolysis protein